MSDKPYAKAVLDIYDDEYVEKYPLFYSLDWEQKNERDLACIDRLLKEGGNWLDLCCGNAWHFGAVSKKADKTGLDLSPAQIGLAKKNNPDAEFILGDVLEIKPDPRFDLVTCFWLAYGYLDDRDLIAEFCDVMVAWLKPGGNLILNIMEGREVATWNAHPRSALTGFRVFNRTPDWEKWSFFDVGGVHNLTTPGLEFFEDRLAGHFESAHVAERFNFCCERKLR
jgi:ubiquinone/menaquinone biosynthesis C-methylase UbiE